MLRTRRTMASQTHHSRSQILVISIIGKEFLTLMQGKFKEGNRKGARESVQSNSIRSSLE